MTKTDSIADVIKFGVGYDDALALRRISLTLRRWHELECGAGSGTTTVTVEREGGEEDGKPFLVVRSPKAGGGLHEFRYPTSDRERGARKRLAAIMARYPGLVSYVQGDPRGCAVYLIRKGDIPEGACLSSFYSRGVAVY